MRMVGLCCCHRASQPDLTCQSFDPGVGLLLNISSPDSVQLHWGMHSVKFLCFFLFSVVSQTPRRGRDMVPAVLESTLTALNPGERESYPL